MVVITTLVGAALAGCVRYHPLEVSPEEAGEAYRTRSLSDSGLVRFLSAELQHPISVGPAARWDLSMLTLAAFYYQPDLDVARAGWGVSRAAVMTAGGRPNPELRVTPEYTTGRNPEFVPSGEEVSPWALSLGLVPTLETAGKRGYRVAQARQLSEAARLEVAAVAWDVRHRVRTSLLALWAGQDRLALARRESSVQDEITRLLERRLAVGEAAQLDVTRERLALSQSWLALGQALRDSAEALAQLAAAIGVPERALDSVSISFDAFEGPPGPMDVAPAELRRQALLGRPDVLRTLAEFAASESALRLEIARQFPDLKLGPAYTWDRGENHYTLGLAALLPIFNRNRGPIAEADARRTEAATRFLALQARIGAELERAQGSYTALLPTAVAADSLLDARERAQGQVRAAFVVGEVDRLSLATAFLEATRAERARLEARVQLWQALGALEDAVQQPLLPHTAPAPTTPERDPRHSGAASSP